MFERETSLPIDVHLPLPKTSTKYIDNLKHQRKEQKEIAKQAATKKRELTNLLGKPQPMLCQMATDLVKILVNEGRDKISDQWKHFVYWINI